MHKRQTVAKRLIVSVIMGQLVDYTEDLHRLAELASRPAALDEFLTRALRSLSSVIPYDLAALYELRDNRLSVRAAVGALADERIRQHTLELSRFPTVKQALEIRRPIRMETEHHAGDEGDPYDGVLDLPHGHACMVVPLFADDRSLGLITLDRQTCGAYPEEAVNLAAVYGQIVSMAMAFATQTTLLERYRRQLKEHNRLLSEEIGLPNQACQRIEASLTPSMQEIARLAQQVAQSDTPVLIHGETGTGKEVLAQAIHSWGPRAEGPFVKLNCAAIPAQLVESELFGHIKGAFSGATKDRPGRFVTANHGTLLLDEIGDMPSDVQAKLLRVLQEGTFEPVGSDRSIRVDVRVIAASHVDLEAAVQSGRFRQDLYYRLAVFPMRLPPLRERQPDVIPIAESILADLANRPGRGPWVLSEPTQACLKGYTWPGNVRELINVLERATILQASGTLEPEHLALPETTSKVESSSKTENSTIDVSPLGAEDMPSILPLREAERRHLVAALRQTQGKIYGRDGAARLLDLKPTTLQSKLKKHGINRLQV